jgi:hypothetical protein
MRSMPDRRSKNEGKSNPDAAWRPKPLEPPVTTATLPSREKMDGKSLRLVCALASAAIAISRALRDGND